MRKRLQALTVAATLGLSTAALALPQINGTINFTASSSCDTTSCTITNGSVSSSFGDFAVLPTGTLATFPVFIFSPFTAQQAWQASAGGSTGTFDVTSQINESQQNISGIIITTVTDAGIANLTGFDPTNGIYSFTAQQNGTVTGSFSATTAATPIPEPGSMLVMGTGLLGLGMIRRFRRGGGDTPS